jgi:hypothetical protein
MTTAQASEIDAGGGLAAALVELRKLADFFRRGAEDMTPTADRWSAVATGDLDRGGLIPPLSECDCYWADVARSTSHAEEPLVAEGLRDSHRFLEELDGPRPFLALTGLINDIRDGMAGASTVGYAVSEVLPQHRWRDPVAMQLLGDHLDAIQQWSFDRDREIRANGGV